MHCLSMPVELAPDLSLPLVGMRLNSLRGQFFVNLERGVIEAEFDDRQIGRGGFEIIGQSQTGDLELGLIELCEGVAEVYEHQIALVAEQGKKRGLPLRSLF